MAFEVDSKARLVEAGQAVDVQVPVTCPAGAEVLEAFFYVTQDGNQSRLTFFQPVCDGTPHTVVLQAEAVDLVFHQGKAQVSGYLLLTSGESTSPTGSANCAAEALRREVVMGGSGEAGRTGRHPPEEARRSRRASSAP